MAFWSTDNFGSVTSFELFTDNDGDATNGGLASVGVFNPLRNPGATGHIAQIFMFAVVTSQFFHLQVLDMDSMTDMNEPGIGELAFRSADLNPIPLPAAFPLFLAGLAGLGIVGRNRRKALA